jgi:hypothetical protein
MSFEIKVKNQIGRLPIGLRAAHKRASFFG